MCAVVLGPFMSVDARGSVGGMTASRARGGKTMRVKSRPSVHRADRIPTNRSILGFIARRWGGLDNNARDQWEAYALDHPGTDKFGDPFIMSGINAYMMLNHKAIRLWNSSHYQETPPAPEPASAVLVLTAITGVGNPGEVDLSWTELGTGVVADYWEVWIAGPFQSEGKVNILNRYHWNSQVPGNVLLKTVANLAEGFWYWFQVRYTDQYGQITAWVTAQATPMLTP